MKRLPCAIGLARFQSLRPSLRRSAGAPPVCVSCVCVVCVCVCLCVCCECVCVCVCVCSMCGCSIQFMHTHTHTRTGGGGSWLEQLTLMETSTYKPSPGGVTHTADVWDTHSV